MFGQKLQYSEMLPRAAAGTQWNTNLMQVASCGCRMTALSGMKASSSMLTLMMPGRCSSSLSVSVLDLDLAANTETALVERLRLALEDDTAAWVAGRSCKRAAIVVTVLYFQLDHL
jgi:hypothetical protein